jgi:hypothetical protein
VRCVVSIWCCCARRSTSRMPAAPSSCRSDDHDDRMRTSRVLLFDADDLHGALEALRRSTRRRDSPSLIAGLRTLEKGHDVTLLECPVAERRSDASWPPSTRSDRGGARRTDDDPNLIRPVLRRTGRSDGLYVWLWGPRMRETSVDQVSIMALNDSSSYASSTPGLLPGRALMSYSTVTVHRLSACSVQRMCTVPA